MKRADEELLSELAKRYVDRYGELLEREADELQRDGNASPTPNLDARVKRRLRAGRISRAATVSGALAAACILALLIVPRIIDPQLPNIGGPSASPSAASPAQAVQPLPAGTSAPWAQSPTADGPGLPADIAIPLSFSLPERFAVSAIEQDRGKTIYRLADRAYDDVVLTLERAGDPPAYEGLEEIAVGHATAHGLYGADYSLLRFERDGIAYELTCRHDINTLIELSRVILI